MVIVEKEDGDCDSAIFGDYESHNVELILRDELAWWNDFRVSEQISEAIYEALSE